MFCSCLFVCMSFNLARGGGGGGGRVQGQGALGQYLAILCACSTSSEQNRIE